MKKIFFFTLGALLATACGQKNEVPDYDQLIDSITNEEQSLTYVAVGADTAKANHIIALYNLFVSNFPDDSLAPVYMFRTAEVQINTGNFEKGIASLDSVMALYPGFEDIAMCQFLKGQAYEANQQYDLAREAYTEFVNNYPDHILAADTRKMIPLIGMTPEEQLEAILAQNHK